MPLHSFQTKGNVMTSRECEHVVSSRRLQYAHPSSKRGGAAHSNQVQSNHDNINWHNYTLITTVQFDLN